MRRVLPVAIALTIPVTLLTTPAHALETGGVPQATCFWFGPLDSKNPLTNRAFPETSATYWGARFRVPDGARLELSGKYPHARFFSINAYVNQGAVDSLEDHQIRPDKGSKNPYKRGADRYLKKRDYTVTVPAPGATGSGKNVLKAPDANPGSVQELIYRVYLPDRPSDGGTKALPVPQLRLADGTVLRGQAMCDAINDPQRYFSVPTLPEGIFKALVNVEGADPATNPAQNPPRWERFFNTPLALSIYRYGTPSQDQRKLDLAAGETGGYYDNRAVRYTVSIINASFGPVVVLRGKLPTTPKTGPRVKKMGSGQLRYWSICNNTSPVETAVVSCVTDAQVRRTLTKGRKFTMVISSRADRPRNARPVCGVTWLDWGTQVDPLGRRSGTLIMRNLGADPAFKQALQKVTPADISVTSDGTRSERDVVGPYLPTGEYMTKAKFEKRGCSR